MTEFNEAICNMADDYEALWNHAMNLVLQEYMDGQMTNNEVSLTWIALEVSTLWANRNRFTKHSTVAGQCVDALENKEE